MGITLAPLDDEVSFAGVYLEVHIRFKTGNVTHQFQEGNATGHKCNCCMERQSERSAKALHMLYARFI